MPRPPKYNKMDILNNMIPGERLTVKQIADNVGCAKNTVRAHIEQLVSDKLVIQHIEEYHNEAGYTLQYTRV